MIKEWHATKHGLGQCLELQSVMTIFHILITVFPHFVQTSLGLLYSKRYMYSYIV